MREYKEKEKKEKIRILVGSVDLEVKRELLMGDIICFVNYL
jgi:hypothetical protein